MASRYVDEPQPLLVWVLRLGRKVRTERGIFVSLVWATACLLLPYDGGHVVSGLGVTVVAEYACGLVEMSKSAQVTLFHHNRLFGGPWKCC